MSLISRITNPQEFYDSTSQAMLLAPEPQYIYARLAMSALSYSFDVESNMGLLPSRAITGHGAPYAQEKDAQYILSDNLYTAAIMAVPELGKNYGEVVRLNRPKYGNSNYDTAGRELGAGVQISTNPIDISSDTVPVTLRRYVGPFDIKTGKPGPFGIDKFASTMSVHKLTEMVGLHMKHDYNNWLDTAIRRLLDNVDPDHIVRPRGMITDDTPATKGSYPFDASLIFEGQKILDEANIPCFSNGQRMMIMSPTQAAQLQADPNYQRLSNYHRDYNPLIGYSYITSIDKTDIFKSNTVSKTNNTNNIRIDYAQMFGPGMAGMGISRLPEVVPSTNDNYGEQALLVWISYAGFATTNPKFGVRITTSE